MSDLTAGRELDIRVAVEVMGWKRTNAWSVSGTPPGESQPVHGCPHYSTDIASARLVVEKMRERGFEVHRPHLGRGVLPHR